MKDERENNRHFANLTSDRVKGTEEIMQKALGTQLTYEMRVWIPEDINLNKTSTKTLVGSVTACSEHEAGLVARKYFADLYKLDETDYDIRCNIWIMDPIDVTYIGETTI